VESAADNSGCRTSRLFAAGLDWPADVLSPLFKTSDEDGQPSLGASTFQVAERRFPAPAYFI